jgi:hypothetical protein
MDIQHFATKEWTTRGVLEFFKIDGSTNPADAMSKVLYRILFDRHFYRLEGCNRAPYAAYLVFRPNPNNNTAEG